MPARTSAPPSSATEGTSWQAHLRAAFSRNLGLKFLALILSCTVFLLVNTEREREISARVRVAYTLPSDRELISERLEEVRVTIRGPWRRLRRFDEREIDRINIDLSRAQDGDVRITPDMVRLPPGLTLTSISPGTMYVAFERRTGKTLEVIPVVAGRPKHGYVVTDIKVEPATVVARGAASTVIAMSSLRTPEVRVEGKSETVTAEVSLSPPSGVELEHGRKVTVTVRIDEELGVRRVSRAKVLLASEGDAARYSVVPAAVDVIFTGKVRLIEALLEARPFPLAKVDGGQPGRRQVVGLSLNAPHPGVGVEFVPPTVELQRR
jgi:YbbR domain-containing protein